MSSLLINAQTALNQTTFGLGSRTDRLVKEALQLYSKTNSFSFECFYTVDFPMNLSYGCKMKATRNPLDTTCGFYYYVKYKPQDQVSDFFLYSGSDVYRSYKDKIDQINRVEKPIYFTEKETITPGYGKGKIPSIVKSPSIFRFSLFEFERQLAMDLNDISFKTIVLKDTLIDETNCFHIKLINNIYEKDVCVDLKTLLPKRLQTFGKSQMGTQITTVVFQNFDVHANIPLSYYSAENLLPKNWKKKNPVSETVNWVGKEAPALSLPTMNNDSTVSLSQFRGKVVLLEFTATWCPHCMEAAEMMNRLNEKFKNNSGTVLLSVFSSSPDTKDRISKFADRFSISNKILYNAAAVGNIYKVEGYPQFFIIDSSGKIVKHYPGYSEAIEKRIVEDMEVLIKTL